MNDPVTECPANSGNSLTYNVAPLLHQIRHALETLSQSNQSSKIDLRSIPLAPGEEDRLLGVLGQGEVSVSIEALGPTRVEESRFPGVWIVTHYNREKEIIARQIEITSCPDILFSPREDIRYGLDMLNRELSDTVDSQPEDSTDLPT